MALSTVIAGNTAAASLRGHKELVVARWMGRVREEIVDASAHSDPALRNDLPEILDALVLYLETDRGEDAREQARELFRLHAAARGNWSSYATNHLLREYVCLRSALLGTLEENGTVSTADRDSILEFIDEGATVTTVRYSEIRGLQERLEIHYLKLIEQLVGESLHGKNVGGHLARLLDVIIEHMRAEAAAVMLWSTDAVEIRLGSASARTPQLADAYRASLVVSWLAASRERAQSPVSAVDVDSLPAESRERLAAIGIRWLLLIQLPAVAPAPGALCVGFREKRVLDPIEVRLLENLGDRLARLLASIAVHDESVTALRRMEREKETIELERTALEEERAHREEVLAAVTHDLRNPLSAAKIGAQLLKQGMSDPGATETVADRIIRSIDRSDRMIHDLLDAFQLRAGKRLPLSMERYAMASLASDVIKELAHAHGDRFCLHAVGEVVGYWSVDAMRRVLENLLLNAVKYGRPGTPIDVTVEEVDGKMKLSVRNEGEPLSVEEQSRIFEPFERATSARRSGQAGWGIGLTLVRGIVDSHGGSICVESSREGGTTFIVANPMDSRPYQAEESLAAPRAMMPPSHRRDP